MGLAAGRLSHRPRLVEVHFGDWQGCTFAELEAREPGSTTARDVATNGTFVRQGAQGESYEMLTARVTPWFESLERPTVCVTHGGIFRVLFRMVGGKPEREAAALDVAAGPRAAVSGRKAGVAMTLQGMIPKSAKRFSEKIMRNERIRERRRLLMKSLRSKPSAPKSEPIFCSTMRNTER